MRWGETASFGGGAEQGEKYVGDGQKQQQFGLVAADVGGAQAEAEDHGGYFGLLSGDFRT